MREGGGGLAGLSVPRVYQVRNGRRSPGTQWVRSTT
jgi:hypothetical protein